ncbi:hypothetical protein P8C59_008937 [Phyllachora maydis]|uniref:Uncharacterized protein n=1 Tax=Phyllachora maydis TaxID=1825666 RepID=A0AAD9ICH7_9PEZI|nr:hypothetical protein P8C59_008937 [Phyllachora maydis]
MGTLAKIALVILGISFTVFVAFFGRLPVFRHTPVAWLHRLISVSIPNGVLAIDQKATSGRLTSCCWNFGQYIMYDRHPTVLIFFLILLIGGEYLYLPAAWPQMSLVHRIAGPIVVVLPFIFLYLAAASDPGTIDASNHRYPGFTLLPPHLSGDSKISFNEWLVIWSWALQDGVALGSVTLLAGLLSPLVWGLFWYNIWLVYSGTTTNESLKWSDWQLEMNDGFAFQRRLPLNRAKDLRLEPAWTRWPVEPEQILVRTQDGRPPRPDSNIAGEGEWERPRKLRELENLYDIGFWGNIRDIFQPFSIFRDHLTPIAEGRVRRSVKKKRRAHD